MFRTPLFLLALLLPIFIVAQNYKIDVLTEGDGLMDNNVKGVFQDNRGIIYAANGSGFTKFFGDHTEQVKYDDYIFDFITIHGIQKIGDTYYWANYQMRGDKITDHNVSENTYDVEVDGVSVTYRFRSKRPVDANGYQWIFTRSEDDSSNTEIWRFKGQDSLDVKEILTNQGIEFNNTTRMVKSGKSKRPLPRYIANFIQDNHGSIWIRSTDSDIHRFDETTKMFVSEKMAIPNACSILIDSSDRLWVTVIPYQQEYNGVYQKSAGQWKWFEVVGRAKLFESPQGEVWMVDDRGVHHFNGRNFEFLVQDSSITHIEFTMEGDLVLLKSGESSNSFWVYSRGKTDLVYSTNSKINDVFVDLIDNIWISTSTGLVRCSNSVYFESSFSDSTGQLSGVYSGTNPNGWRFIKNREMGVFAIKEDSVIHLIADKLGYFSTSGVIFDNGLYVVGTVDDRAGQLAKVFKVLPSLEVVDVTSKDLLVSCELGEISKFSFQFFDSKIFIATDIGMFVELEDGFKLFPINREVYERVHINPCEGVDFQMFTCWFADESQTSDQRFQKLMFDFDEMKYEEVAIQHDSTGYEFKLITDYGSGWLALGEKKLLINDNLNSVYFNVPMSNSKHKRFEPFGHPLIDRSGLIYYRTLNSGLIRFNPADSSHIQISQNDGLSDNYVGELFFNFDSTAIWLTTRQAINRLVVSSISEENEIKLTSWHRDFKSARSQGYELIADSLLRLYMYTGFVQFDLGRLIDTVTPNIHFTGLKLFYEDVDWTKFVCDIDSAYGYQVPANMQLPYNQNHLTFDFQGVSQRTTSTLKYEYRLFGQDERFYSTDLKSVTYTNLDAGNYKFVIRVLPDDGVSSKDQFIEFVIAKPFWETAWFITLVSASFLLSLYGFYLWRVRALKARQVELETEVDNATKEIRQQKNEIEERKEEVEKRNEEILASINYAKKLQTAVLPPARVVKEFFADSFLLYLPRDIVSGDFYWMESKGDISYFAVADCTGHGVPGAMLSVIGMNGLNRALNEQKLTEPKDILTSLSEHVQRHFEQSEATVRDGMDICLCALDTKTKKLTYAGANNPVWIARAGEMHILKPDRRAIGHHNTDTQFTQQEFQLQDGDTIYLSSDGYQDQLGGPKSYKLMTKVFREKLRVLSSEPLDKQRDALLTDLETWKGTHNQTDDICVMGIRV